MILEFLLRVLVQLCSVIALLGLGSGAARLLRANLTLFEKVAFGACAFIIFGRWIGTWGLFTFPVAIVIAIGGIVLAAMLELRPWLGDPERKGFSARHAKLLLFAVPALFLMLGAQSGYWFSPGDDMQGYFPFIQKVIGTGGAGLSQFSDKRQFDFGGIHFLSAPFVRMFDMSAVRMSDMGLGVVILFGLLGERAWRRRSPALWCAVVSLCAFSLVTFSRVVNSPHYLVVALCLLLFMLLLETSATEGRRPIVVGIVAAAVIAVKLTALPLVGIVLVGFVLVEGATRGIRSSALYAGVCAAVVAVSLAPFLWASLESTGTLLFPVLGLGWQDRLIHGPYVARQDGTLGNVVKQIRESRALIVMLGACLLGVVVALRKKNRPDMIQLGAPALATFVTMMMIIWSGLAMGEHIHAVRYSLPFYTALALWLVSNVDLLFLGRRIVGVTVSALVLLSIYWCHKDFLFGGGVSQVTSDIAFAATGSTAPGEKRWPYRFALMADVDAYAKLQQAVPAGEKMLVVVDRSFLFDYGRNPIETADCPGRVSPPPFMPIHGTTEEMIAYLRQVGVHYVAFSYANSANYTPQLLETRMKPEELPLTRYCATGYFMLQNHIRAMKDRLGVVYDDGQRYVINVGAAPGRN